MTSRETFGQRMRELWKDPVFRARRLKQMKKQWDDTSKRMKGKQINKGRKFTETHKQKIRAYKHTEESKNKIRGRKPWNYIDGRSKVLGPARYGDDWNKIRILIYRRDNYTCQDCGITMAETKKAHHIHHKIPFLKSFDNNLSNLITLCPSCHGREDARMMKESKERGRLIWST